MARLRQPLFSQSFTQIGQVFGLTASGVRKAIIRGEGQTGPRRNWFRDRVMSRLRARPYCWSYGQIGTVFGLTRAGTEKALAVLGGYRHYSGASLRLERGGG